MLRAGSVSRSETPIACGPSLGRAVVWVGWIAWRGLEGRRPIGPEESGEATLASNNITISQSCTLNQLHIK
ncbi:MAG: hypothetical protein M0Q13_15940 [Methanothrix sp.]|nr:hypothetical protein [Methanothrix sp.]